MKFLNIKIGSRLGLGFGFVLLVTVGFGLFATFGIKQMWQITDSLYQHTLQVSKAVRQIQIDITAMHRSMKDVPLAKNITQVYEARHTVEELEKNVYASFDIVFEKFLGNMDDAHNAYEAFNEWKPIREEVIQLQLMGKTTEAAAITKGKSANHVELLNRKIKKMVDFANSKGYSLYVEAETVKNNTIRNSQILLAIIVVLGIIIALTITHSIIKPLSVMKDVSEQITMGNLSARNQIDTGEEIGVLARSVNNLADAVESRSKIQKNVVEISETMIDVKVLEDFSPRLVRKLLEISEANIGVMYVLNKEKSEYECVFSIGADSDFYKPISATNPEGLIGNTLSRKEIFYLNNIPKDTSFIYKTTAGNAKPRSIITIPVMVDNQAVALISLVSIFEFSDETKEFIKLSWRGINTTYSNLKANEKTYKLAAQLVKINQKLEIQTEELQEQSAELQKQAQKLQEQNIVLEEQRANLESANKMKSEFLSNMGHELRTPLNSIMALSNVLIMQTKDILDDEENNYLKIIERNGKRLLSLINDILDLSKLEAGRMEVFPVSISVSNLLDIVMENMEPLCKQKNLSIKVEVADNLPMIESDESKLHQVLTNIVGNAIKFTHEGGINIKAKYDTRNVYIDVKDTGIGLSKEIIPTIFDEFKQVDGSSSRKYEGTGLGLAIAKKIIDILGGSIDVDSKLGKGAVFTITIPIKWFKGIITEPPFPIKKDLIISDEGKSADEQIAHSTQKRLLIVEDDEDTVVQLRAVLKKENYIIDVAYNGQEALNYLQTNIPDGIIQDLVMPGIDGIELIQKIRSMEKTRSIPILILTASDLTKEDLAKLSSNKVQQLIQKGNVDIYDILDKVKHMLES